jgi:hypothetical protein
MTVRPNIKLIEPTPELRRGFLDYIVRSIVRESYQRHRFLEEISHADAQKELGHQRETSARSES